MNVATSDNMTLSRTSDEESHAANMTGGPVDYDLKVKGEKAPSSRDLEPFGNEDTAEVKYRTMKWW